MADRSGNRLDRSRRTLLKGALLSGALAGCLGSGDEDPASSGSEIGGFSATPTATPTPIPGRQEAHPLPDDADVLDRIVFGSEPSESAHDLAPETSVVTEALGDRLSRQIEIPDESNAIGSMSFTMACAPEGRTYLTLKLPGNMGGGPLVLFDSDDDIVGTTGARGAWPSLTTRMFRGGSCDNNSYWPNDATTHSTFTYMTHRLPRQMTEGKDSLEIRLGFLGSDVSMPIPRVYTHTSPLFELPSDESAEEHDTGTPAGPAEDPMAPYIETINDMVESVQSADGAVNDRPAHGIALAYSRDDWIEAVDKDAIVETVVATADDYAIRQAQEGPEAVVQRGWSEHGNIGRAIEKLVEPLEERELLSAELEDHPDSPMTRREAYAQFLDEGIEWRRKRKRGVYNQVAIVHKNLLRANRALEILDPDRTRDQETIDRWIDQFIGIAPLELEEDAQRHPFWVSGSYYGATEAGITKEGCEYDLHYGPLGIHETVVLAHETGLDRVKERAKEMVEAFGNLRWPVKGGCGSGNQAIAADGALSLRGFGHPGNTGKWRGYGFSPLQNAMVLEDDVSRRWAELAIEHDAISVDGWRGNEALRRRIPHVEAYRAVDDMDASEYTVPHNRDQHVWVDVDMGLVHVVDGDTRFMTNIPHSASTNANDHGVTERCAVHYHDPEQGDRIVQTDVRRLEYPYNGDTWTRPDNLVWPSDFLGDNAGEIGDRTRYLPWRDSEKELHNAMAGEEVPQASQPNGDPWPKSTGSGGPWKVGNQPDPRVGMGISYREVRFGQYLVGINSTGAEERGFEAATEYEMEVPTTEATNLETGETVTDETLTVAPRSGVVLKLSE